MGEMVDIEHFISEVKRKPVLWDPNHADYNQRHTKLAAWEEVSANMYVDWGDFSNYDKFGKVRDMQTRWKNIRDCYIRELKYDRKVEKGVAMPKKNKYKYYHLLQFLNITEKRKSKGSDQSSTDVEESPEKKEEMNKFNINNLDCEVESSPMDLDTKDNQVKLNGNRRAKRLKQNNTSMQMNLQSDSSTMDSDSNNQTVNKDMSLAKQNNVSKEMLQQPNSSVKLEKNTNQMYNNGDPTTPCFQDYFNSDNSNKINAVLTSSSIEMPQGHSKEMHQDYFNSENSNKFNAELTSSSIEMSQGVSSLPLDQDDDKMFLLSLAPYFKKLNEERKLEARIEMSTLLQKMIYKKC